MKNLKPLVQVILYYYFQLLKLKYLFSLVSKIFDDLLLGKKDAQNPSNPSRNVYIDIFVLF